MVEFGKKNVNKAVYELLGTFTLVSTVCFFMTTSAMAGIVIVPLALFVGI